MKHSDDTTGLCIKAALLCFTAIFAAFFLIFPVVRVSALSLGEEEVEVGSAAAKQFEEDKSTKLVEDAELLARVQAIGQEIAKVANEREIEATYGKSAVYKFDYLFKIVEDDSVNAFALPGGFVYVNKALLDYAQSDDELAGVIAHEVAHVAHHHTAALVSYQEKQSLLMVGTVLVGALTGIDSDSLLSIASLTNLVMVAQMSGYGQKAEFDADRTAVAYLSETKYNPSGMLTFIERLALDESRRPEVEFGIFKNHPDSYLRAKAIISEIQTRGITINRRLVTTYMRVEVKPVADSTASSIWIGSTEIVRLADSSGISAADRAEKVASDLWDALLNGAKLRDVKLGEDGKCIIIFGKKVLCPSVEDADLSGKTIEKLAESAATSIKKSLLKELFEQGYH